MFFSLHLCSRVETLWKSFEYLWKDLNISGKTQKVKFFREKVLNVRVLMKD
jgi:hypothetical protein